jgi:glucose 1-dehydrogenase
MRALALDFARRTLAWGPHPDPGPPGPGQVRWRVQEVGVCGTDRELARFQIALPPAGESTLVLGHEALGQVESVGPGVTTLQPGDWVVPMLRRSCPSLCPSCARFRRDLCLTSEFLERGIVRAHGYFVEHALDDSADLVRLPAGLSGVAVLAEPMSVVRKAIEAALSLHPGQPRTAAVLGAGPIGLLSALALQADGFPVELASLEPSDHPRLRVLGQAGIPYANVRDRLPSADIVLEATGSGDAVPALLERLPSLGVLVLLGAHQLPAFSALRLILLNQTIRGVVNAGPPHFAQAIDSLRRIHRPHLELLLTRRGAGSAPQSLFEAPGQTVKPIHVLAE